MRKKMIVVTAAGALALGGVAVAVGAPALADPGTEAGETSLVDRIRDALEGLVSDGTLTDEQADEVAGTLSAADLGRHGGHHGGRLDLAAAATALDLTEDELRTALEAEGTTLADVAEAQGIGVDTLIAALVTAEEERIAQAVEDARLSQEEADERLADLEQRVTERVDSDFPGRPDGDGFGRDGRDGDENADD